MEELEALREESRLLPGRMKELGMLREENTIKASRLAGVREENKCLTARAKDLEALTLPGTLQELELLRRENAMRVSNLVELNALRKANKASAAKIETLEINRKEDKQRIAKIEESWASRNRAETAELTSLRVEKISLSAKMAEMETKHQEYMSRNSGSIGLSDEKINVLDQLEEMHELRQQNNRLVARINDWETLNNRRNGLSAAKTDELESTKNNNKGLVAEMERMASRLRAANSALFAMGADP